MEPPGQPAHCPGPSIPSRLCPRAFPVFLDLGLPLGSVG